MAPRLKWVNELSKWKILPILVTIMVALAILLSCSINIASASPSLYENYNTGDDWGHGFYDTYWMAQSFKVGFSGHTVTYIRIKAYRTGAPGNISAGIRALGINDHPTGEDLTSGIVDGNSFTTDSGGEWYEISLAECALSANTSYAIVDRKSVV